jgi:hypothetical protein
MVGMALPLWGRPSLPPMLVAQDVEPGLPETSPDVAPPAAPTVADRDSRAVPAEVDLEKWWRGMVRAYEPTQIGYTFQEDDESFMDFSISLMVPVLHNVYPDRPVDERRGIFKTEGRTIYPYFAFTGRAGQYLGTRDSSPVVGKQFNPLFILRHWTTDMDNPALAEPDNYIDLIYAHESNGQWIDDGVTFAEVSRLHHSFNEARDEISRGWDYVGLNVSRRGYWLPGLEESQRWQLKLSHYLDTGIMQGDAEEYYPWELDPEGKQRNDVDGLWMRFDFEQPIDWLNFGSDTEGNETFGFNGRVGLTWFTGISQPFAHNTFEVEVGFLINGFPLEAWYRNGYMTDLTDYYRKLESGGVRVSFWQF